MSVGPSYVGGNLRLTQPHYAGNVGTNVGFLDSQIVCKSLLGNFQPQPPQMVDIETQSQ